MVDPNDPDPKLEELRKRGALHPRPEQVTDELFTTAEFFDPRDAIQVKYEMLRWARIDGQPVARVVRDHGYSRPTFYEAQAAFERDGLPGLLPRKRGAPVVVRSGVHFPLGTDEGAVFDTRDIRRIGPAQVTVRPNRFIQFDK